MVSLGELMTTFYEEFLRLTGNEDCAAVMTADAINDLLAIDAGEKEMAAA